MKIEILLPTEYITSDLHLAKLSKNLLDKVESELVNLILNFEGGVTKTRVEGYYKSNKGIVTKSKYISLVVYTDNVEWFKLLISKGVFDSYCKRLKQESIGVVIDNRFLCLS